MGRSARQALRYALLGTLRSDRPELWTVGAGETVSDADFERQLAEVCGLAREVQATNRRRDGGRAIEATKQRIATRDRHLSHRTALDLQRLHDLEDRQTQRRARALQQKWFVIGRVIETAMQSDPHLRTAVLRLLRAAELRKDERLCLGLART